MVEAKREQERERPARSSMMVALLLQDGYMVRDAWDEWEDREQISQLMVSFAIKSCSCCRSLVCASWPWPSSCLWQSCP